MTQFVNILVFWVNFVDGTGKSTFSSHEKYQLASFSWYFFIFNLSSSSNLINHCLFLLKIFSLCKYLFMQNYLTQCLCMHLYNRCLIRKSIKCVTGVVLVNWTCLIIMWFLYLYSYMNGQSCIWFNVDSSYRNQLIILYRLISLFTL